MNTTTAIVPFVPKKSGWREAYIRAMWLIFLRTPHNPAPEKVYVPGFTSEEALKNCKNEVVVFDEPLKQHIHDAVRKQSAS